MLKIVVKISFLMFNIRKALHSSSYDQELSGHHACFFHDSFMLNYKWTMSTNIYKLSSYILVDYMNNPKSFVVPKINLNIERGRVCE